MSKSDHGVRPMTTPDSVAAARTLVELVCQWVEIAGRLEGRKGQRNLSFSLIVDRDGNNEPALERIQREVAQAIAAHTAQVVREREDYKMWFEEERLSRQRERTHTAQAVKDRDMVWWEKLALVDNVAPEPDAVKDWILKLAQYEVAQAVAERDDLIEMMKNEWYAPERWTALVEHQAQQAEEIARLTKERDGYKSFWEDAFAANSAHQATNARLRAALERFNAFEICSTFDAKGSYTKQKSIELAVLKAETAAALRASAPAEHTPEQQSEWA
jgi:hypothetical protein